MQYHIPLSACVTEIFNVYITFMYLPLYEDGNIDESIVYSDCDWNDDDDTSSSIEFDWHKTV